MVWNRFLKSHWLTVMLQASPERKEEYDAARAGWGKGFILRDETSCSTEMGFLQSEHSTALLWAGCRRTGNDVE